MKRLIIISLCVLFAGTTAMAFPTQVFHVDGPQDPLFVPEFVHELGTAPVFLDFPDELIDAIDSPIDLTVCLDPLTPDDLLMPNVVVSMINLTGIDWREVWYVANEETFHSNFDGFVGDFAGPGIAGTAFRIDDKANNPLDIHTPLIFESMTPDGIFEAGEIWDFVIQDYSNLLGLPASALGSIGVPSLTPAIGLSSGSIIAVPVPEPATICMLGMGALALIRKRRK